MSSLKSAWAWGSHAEEVWEWLQGVLATDTDAVRFLPPSWWPPLLLKCLFLSYKPDSGGREPAAAADWMHAAAEAAARLLRGKIEEEKVEVEGDKGGEAEELAEGGTSAAAVQFVASLLSSRWKPLFRAFAQRE